MSGIVMGQHVNHEYSQNGHSLAERGYKFVAASANSTTKVEPYQTFNIQLRNIHGSPFTYIDEYHYNNVGALVYQYVQQQMEEYFKMEEVWVPFERTDKLRSNIYMTKQARTTKGRLAVIVSGTRTARPGVWARSLCINKSLQIGSLLPYIEMLVDHGFEVMVLNPNFNTIGEVPIPFNKTPEMHLSYCWEKIIKPSKVSEILFVTHYYGGAAALSSLLGQDDIHIQRVKGMVFLDSLHRSHVSETMMKPSIKKLLQHHSVHYRISEQPCGTRRPGYEASWDSPIYSAGTMSSERVPAFAFERITEWIFEKFPALDHQHVTPRQRANGQTKVRLISPEMSSPSSLEIERVSPPIKPTKPAATKSDTATVSVTSPQWVKYPRHHESPKKHLAGSARGPAPETTEDRDEERPIDDRPPECLTPPTEQ